MSHPSSSRLLQRGHIDRGTVATTQCDIGGVLYDAALSNDAEAVNAAVALARDLGVTDACIADLHLPLAVRSLGAHWADDTISWAQVTIGTARLQSVLRRIGRRIDADSAGHAFAPTVMLVAGHDVAHTFGPMLLAHQLRRRGVSVALSLDTQIGGIGERFRRVAPDAVFVSAAQKDRVETLSQFVKEVRVFNAGVPIVVGGPLIGENDDLGIRIGADIATSDLDRALAGCGLTQHSQLAPV